VLSPPLIVSHSPFPHEGQGGRCFFERTSIVLPQFVYLYVPAETSLPAGTGFATRLHPCLEKSSVAYLRSGP
jgi:hypothetical protein